MAALTQPAFRPVNSITGVEGENETGWSGELCGVQEEGEESDSWC